MKTLVVPFSLCLCFASLSSCKKDFFPKKNARAKMQVVFGKMRKFFPDSPGISFSSRNLLNHTPTISYFASSSGGPRQVVNSQIFYRLQAIRRTILQGGLRICLKVSGWIIHVISNRGKVIIVVTLDSAVRPQAAGSSSTSYNSPLEVGHAVRKILRKLGKP